MKKITQNTFTGGLNSDSLPDLVPKDQYDYALNAVTEDTNGSIGGLISECSNSSCNIFNDDMEVIGHVRTVRNNTEEFVLFLAKPDKSNSAISIFNPSTCYFKRIIEGACLNFDVRYKVNALCKVKNNYERVIYFTDNYNNYRLINIDSLDQYKIAGNLSCPLLSFTRNEIFPIFSATEIIDGGNLSLGTYRAYVRYVSKDNTKENIIAETGPITIYKDSTANQYFNIDGGYNLSSSGIAGSEQYPKSNKAIKFTLSSLDTTFNYVEITIVEFISGTGAVGSVHTSPLLPITGSTLTWTYTGLNSFATGSVDDLSIDKVPIMKVKAHTQKDNRLFIANTIEDNILDYALIQQAALNIPVRWKAKKIVKFNPLVEGASKHPINNRTYMRDEVYSLGIRGIYLDGTSTPVFHIPGRAAISSPTGKIDLDEVWRIRDSGTGLWDKKLMNTNLGIDLGLGETQHLTKYITSNQIERWRVYNTGYVDTNTSTELSGVLSYYECDELYPNIPTPSGPLYGALTGTPIRHHKLPDSNTVLHATNSEIRPMYFELDINGFIAALPTSITNNIQKWIIVQGDRTDNNKTVLDKGITTLDENKRVTEGFGSTPQNVSNIKRFYSAKSLYKRSNFNATHYKVEWYNDLLQFRAGSDPGITPPHSDHANNGSPGSDFYYEYHDWVGKLTQDVWAATSRHFSNFTITGASYVDPAIVNGVNQTKTQGLLYDSNGTLSSLSETANASYNAVVYHMFLPYGTDLKSNLTYGSLKQEKSVYGDLSLVTYFDANNSPSISDPNKITLLSGDTYISNLAVLISSMCPDQLRHEVHYRWVESDLNIGLRHSDNVFSGLDSQVYYKGWHFFDGISSTLVEFPPNALDEYMISLNRANGGTNVLAKSTAEKRMLKEALQYNDDYSYHNSVKSYFPLSDKYDYTLFQNKFKNRQYYRIRYSEKDFQELNIDNFKNIKALNYVDIDAQFGEINDLFVDKNDVFARTHKTILLVPTNVQTIQGNETSVFLGKADVIPYEPKPITSVPNNYGGGYDFTHRLSTEYGTVLLDVYSRKVFLLRDGLKDISIGMHSFFNQYAHFDLLDKNCDYLYDKVVMYYDTWLNRFILTLHTYRLRDKAAFIGHQLSYDEVNNRIVDVFPDGTTVYRNIANIADKESFSISYSFKANGGNGAWVSFHSYKPNWAFAFNNGFVSYYKDTVLGVNGLFNHYDNTEYTLRWLNFYGNQYPFIVESTINEDAAATKKLEHLTVYSETGEWSYMDAYTDKQHTGHQPLNLVPQMQNSMTQQLFSTNLSTISSKEGYLNISNIFDKVIDSSLLIWQKNTRLEKILNTSNFYTVLNMNQGRLRNNWIKVRLEYNLNLSKPKKQTIWYLQSLVDEIQR